MKSHRCFACLLRLAVLVSLVVGRAAGAVEPLVFVNVDVFDGYGMIRDTIVLVRDGMIRQVGPDVATLEGATIINGDGKTLLPGLIDAHTHLGMTFGEQFLRDALDFGVTTELEMWGSQQTRRMRDEMAAAERFDVADLRTAVTGVTAPGGHPTQMGLPDLPTLGPDDDAQAFVDARIAEGADYIKIIYEHDYPTLTKERIADVVAAAHRRNKLVVVHISLQSEAIDAIEAGADGLVHIFADEAPDERFVELAAERGVFVVATLSVFDRLSNSDATWWRDDARVSGRLSSSMRSVLERRFPATFAEGRHFEHAKAAVGALHRAGVRVLAGTDAPAPGIAHGLGVHRELELLVGAGLSPIEVLRAATSEPARAFGFLDRGRIAPGLRADLVLVNGDPTADITATRDIVGSWKLGVAHTRQSAEPAIPGN